MSYVKFGTAVFADEEDQRRFDTELLPAVSVAQVKLEELKANLIQKKTKQPSLAPDGFAVVCAAQEELRNALPLNGRIIRLPTSNECEFRHIRAVCAAASKSSPVAARSEDGSDKSGLIRTIGDSLQTIVTVLADMHTKFRRVLLGENVCTIEAAIAELKNRTCSVAIETSRRRALVNLIKGFLMVEKVAGSSLSSLLELQAHVGGGLATSMARKRVDTLWNEFMSNRFGTSFEVYFSKSIEDYTMFARLNTDYDEELCMINGSDPQSHVRPNAETTELHDASMEWTDSPLCESVLEIEHPERDHPPDTSTLGVDDDDCCDDDDSWSICCIN